MHARLSNVSRALVGALMGVWTGGSGVAAESAEAVQTFVWDEAATEAFLDAIIMVETDGRWNAVGTAGERGGFQFSPRTWDEVAPGWPFWFAHDPEASRVIARAHLKLIQRRLRHYGLPADPWHCAAAWNSGAAAVAGGRLGSAQRSYADRASNLTFVRLVPSSEPQPRLMLARVSDGEKPEVETTGFRFESVPLTDAAVADDDGMIRFKPESK